MKLELKKSEKRFGGIEVRIDGKLFDNAASIEIERHTVRLQLVFDGADVTYEHLAAPRAAKKAK